MKLSTPSRSLLLIAASFTHTHACLSLEERGFAPPSTPVHVRPGTGTPIGSGDRFNDGTIAPQGLGTRPASDSFSTILSLDEVSSGLDALASTYGLEKFTAPYPTYEKRSVVGGKVGGSGETSDDAYHVFLNANIHARERGAADGLLYFIADLLYANKTGSGLSYGKQKYTNAQVVSALKAGVVFVPVSNPDGVACEWTCLSDVLEALGQADT